MRFIAIVAILLLFFWIISKMEKNLIGKLYSQRIHISYCFAKTDQTQWFIILPIWKRECIKSTKIEDKTEKKLLTLARTNKDMYRRKDGARNLLSFLLFHFDSIL